VLKLKGSLQSRIAISAFADQIQEIQPKKDYRILIKIIPETREKDTPHQRKKHMSESSVGNLPLGLLVRVEQFSNILELSPLPSVYFHHQGS
jgi:hypothetical protein